MEPLILYRPPDPLHERERPAMEEAGFEVYVQRAAVPSRRLVIGRYSVLPYYRELEEDLKIQGSQLINSLYEHEYIADLAAWTEDLGNLTPHTFTDLHKLPERMAFVVKGQTNSRKDRWNTHMFAKDRRDAVDVTLRLQEDSLINSQKIYYREYVPLKTYMVGLNGLPITEEYRFFVCDGRIISGAFYWSSYVDDLPNVPEPPVEAYSCVKQAIARLWSGVFPRFLVVDVARTERGNFIVIELNDGQMSGLSENDPKTIYTGLHEVLTTDRNKPLPIIE